jgi:nucleoside-diphosphate-sugar epimerase
VAGHVFVTGANGRIGQHLIQRLIAEGQEVVGTARTEAKAAEVRALGATCLVGELSQPTMVDQGIHGAKVIYHLAGGVRGAGTATPDRVNRQSTLYLIDRLKQCNTLEALVFTSSCAVHGDRSGLWLDENMPAHPHTRYGKAKLDSENALLSAAQAHSLPLRIVRLAAVYGPGFPFLLEDWIRGNQAKLPGEGRNYVPTIHIDDAVEGLIRCAAAGAQHSLYNLADVEPVTLAEFYGAVAKATGGSVPKFWSTWVPSYIQFGLARWNEKIQSQFPMTPRFTPDNLRLFTASCRLQVERMERERGMIWKYPRAIEGVMGSISTD